MSTADLVFAHSILKHPMNDCVSKSYEIAMAKKHDECSQVYYNTKVFIKRILYRSFVIALVNCDKKGYMQNLPNIKIEGVTRH